MAKLPSAPTAFIGDWRIVEMDNWDQDYLDLVEVAHLRFDPDSSGEIAFGTLKGFLDVRFGVRDGAPCAEFSWQGYDEADSTSGRGWALLADGGRLVGHFFIHDSDDSAFVCVRS